MAMCVACFTFQGQLQWYTKKELDVVLSW